MSMDMPVGMVDSLAGRSWSASEEELRFARAYLAEGPIDPAMAAAYREPARMAEREALKAQRAAQDWAALGRYRDENAAAAGRPVDAVFIGDSITEIWGLADPDFFSGGIVNRGISGQTSQQILLRFMQDVVALKPRVVHVMCGVNDIAGNTGPTTPADYHNNILAMTALAQAHGIRVILASLTPAAVFPWAPAVIAPADRVAALNTWLAGLARARGFAYADYHAALATDGGAMRSGFARDGIHPTATGYRAMQPERTRALAEALSRQR